MILRLCHKHLSRNKRFFLAHMAEPEPCSSPGTHETFDLDLELVHKPKGTPRSRCIFFCGTLVAVAVSGAAIFAWAESRGGPLDPGYLWSGYGCTLDCGRGDVNYELDARLERYVLPGSANAAPGQWSEEAAMYTRTFVGTSGPFCAGEDGRAYNGSTGPIGPCLTVNPGQRITIRVHNLLDHGMAKLSQRAASKQDYWEMARDPEANLDDVRVGPESNVSGWFGSAPSSAEEMLISNPQDIPGADVTFDDVNLHLHGMQIVPHLFYPLGTSDPSAPWVTIKPASEDPSSACFCYVFTVPEDHPQGTYFYHIHRHGSVAMQGWQGMLGVLQVGDASSPGSPAHDLNSQGVTREAPFVMWEWSVVPTAHTGVGGGPHTYIEGSFTDGGGAAQTFPVNNAFQPTFDMQVNETLPLKLVCAQATTGSAVYFLDDQNQVVPFHVFASDGISYGRAYEKRMLVVGVGQREGLLLQFHRPGLVRAMQGIVNDFQGTGEGGAGGLLGPGPGPGGKMPGSPDRPMAFFHVAHPPSPVARVALGALTFTPGMGVGANATISPAEISSQLGVRFEVNTALDTMPTPQFVIDQQEFDYRDIRATVRARGAAQWTLTSNMNYFHPFHVHVNPFLVKSVTSGFLEGSDEFRRAVVETNMVPTPMWRDTVFIPPMGSTVIWQHFGRGRRDAWQGKTVFHCHFLDHEDQGMIAAFMIAAPEAQGAS